MHAVRGSCSFTSADYLGGFFVHNQKIPMETKLADALVLGKKTKKPQTLQPVSRQHMIGGGGGFQTVQNRLVRTIPTTVLN